MRFINSDINTFSNQTEDSSISKGETAEPGEITEPDQGATKSTPDGATASSVKSGDEVERGREPERKPERKPLPTVNRIKLTFKSGGASAGSNPFKSPKTRKSEDGYLVWAPKTWRSDLKPMIRCMIEGHDGSKRIKYLTWDQSEDEDFTPEDPPGDFFTSMRGGDWNHATICFVEFFDDDNKDIESGVINEVSQYERIELPKLSESAIWAEKPCVEWAGLRFKDIKLRDTFGPGNHAHRGRLRVVTHEAIGDGKTEMVMKIWPTPMCSKLDLENEMMAYKACAGMGITPEFIGYVTEQGRHISMLTAYHSKAHKPKTDEEKELCRIALHTFQVETGWQRRPLANHRDNYLIEDGKALLIDLAKADNPERVAKNGGEWTQKLLDENFDRYWDWPFFVEQAKQGSWV